MDYKELEKFIKFQMKMTHVYQPLMIKSLLESRDNTATVEDVARQFMNEDPVQLSYYTQIAKRWPAQVLKKHNVVEYHRGRNDQPATFRLLLDDVSPEQRARLAELCDLRLHEFIDKDPVIRRIRELDKASVSGGLRYEVLSKSGGVCLACGVKSTAAMLHVDHIIPRSMGGPTEIGNLQPLCDKCNQQKSNRDDRDFLNVHKRLQFRKRGCSMCKNDSIVDSNILARTIVPRMPETDEHRVVVPHSHIGSFADMLPAEKHLCMDLVNSIITNRPRRRFDISVVDGADDGHCRIDIIPR